jgi:hypothetical protein
MGGPLAYLKAAASTASSTSFGLAGSLLQVFK